MSNLPHCTRPCTECPWRADTDPGKFPLDRYEALAVTIGAAGHEAGVGAPMFACHMTAEGSEKACAGWLAVAGIEHLGVRLAVATGDLDADTLAPRAGWPPLFGSYAEMVDEQAR